MKLAANSVIKSRRGRDEEGKGEWGKRGGNIEGRERENIKREMRERWERKQRQILPREANRGRLRWRQVVRSRERLWETEIEGKKREREVENSIGRQRETGGGSERQSEAMRIS